MGSMIIGQLRSRAVFASILLLIAVLAAGGTLLAQSAMFSNNYYNVYGQGLYLDNYAQLAALTARSRGYAANFYPGANMNYQTFGSQVNSGYQNGMYIQNNNSAAYYNPYRNN